MEKIESIEDVLLNMDKKIVYQTKSSLLSAVLLFVLAIVVFTVNAIFEWQPTSIYPHLFLMLGSISFIIGIIKAFFRKTFFVSAVNHQRLFVHEIYFDVNEQDKLVRLIKLKSLEEIKTLKMTSNSGLKLRFMSTKDGQLCFSQIAAYVPFEYMNVNMPEQHTQSEAHVLLGLIK